MAFIKLFALLVVFQFSIISCQVDPGTPLFLTPLINSGQIDAARNLSRVGTLPLSAGIPERESYSGFMTVNETYNSNMFFWFFPAINNRENGPLMLWLEGGAGASMGLSLFNQHGPYIVNTAGELEARPTDWTVNHSIIYVDSPVGAGFSFTDDPRGIGNSSEDAAVNTVEFLRQFFLIFTEFSTNPLFVSGHSYGGHMSPPVVSMLHKNNEQNIEPKTNLTGLIIWVGLINAYEQLPIYGDYFHHLGLIDNSWLEYFHAQEALMKDLILRGQLLEAGQLWQHLIYGPENVFSNISGFASATTALSDLDLNNYRYGPYVNRPEFRLAAHTGNVTYDIVNFDVQDHLFAGDLMMPKGFYIEEMLDAAGGSFHVTIVAAQFDATILHKGLDDLLLSFDWSGAEEFRMAGRSIWKYQNSTVAGYEKHVKNLSYYFVRNAGHFTIPDQPEWCLDLLNQVTSRVY